MTSLANVRPVFADMASMWLRPGCFAEVLRKSSRSGCIFSVRAFTFWRVSFSWDGVSSSCREYLRVWRARLARFRGFEQIVYTRDGLFSTSTLDRSVAEEFLRLGTHVIDLRGQRVEIDVLLRRKQGAAWCSRCLRAAGRISRWCLPTGSCS